MERRVHSLDVLLVSTRESCGADAEASVKRRLGVDVPAPIFPVLRTTKCVDVAFAVDEAIRNTFEFVSPLFALTDNFAKGEVVPMPTLPLISILIPSVRVDPLVVEKAISEPYPTPSNLTP